MVKEAHFSTHIEDTTLTLDQADGILRGESIANVARDDPQLMILQHIVDGGQASVEETCERFDLVCRIL